jgi:hypothetical protein
VSLGLRGRWNFLDLFPSLLCGAALAVGGTAAMAITEPLGATACQNNHRYYYADATSTYQVWRRRSVGINDGRFSYTVRLR